MPRCGCESTCACVLTGANTECIETTVTGTGSVANPYVITSEFICETADSLNPAVRAFHSVDQSIADNTETVVALDSERFDNDTMHDLVVTNSRITFNTAGVYIVAFSGAFAPSGDYVATYADLRLNGATKITFGPSGGTWTIAGAPRIGFSMPYKFIIGDYVEAIVFQDNTADAARNLINNAQASPEFSAVWVSAG